MISEDNQTPILENPTIVENNMEEARAQSEREASLAPLCAVFRTKVRCRGDPPLYIYLYTIDLTFVRELLATECKRI